MEFQLTHLRLIVSNYKETFLFYRDLLGFVPDWGDENTGYAEFNNGSIQLAIVKKEFMAGIIPITEQPLIFRSTDRASLIFAVDDIDRVYQKLQDQNVTIVAPPTERPEWGIRTTHFRDPDGNLIEIYTNLGQYN
jgi:catechol 2,3-dioxygenase-like lactoylglutathione lyase family enzyme